MVFRPTNTLSFSLTSPAFLNSGTLRDVSKHIWNMSLCFYFPAMTLSSELIMSWLQFLHHIFVESSTKTVTMVSQTCSSLNFLLCSLTTWMSFTCVLGLILDGCSFLERSTIVPSFVHVWVIALFCASVGSQRLSLCSLRSLLLVSHLLIAEASFYFFTR